jgi:DNA polymerase-1
LRVESIQDSTADVWDLTVPGSECFIGNGVVSHNTGRLSSSNPNFQNISTKGGIREAFIPTDGCLMIVADYNQLELRMGGCIAHRIFGKSNIVEKYRQGLDLHEATRQTYDALGIDRFNEAIVGADEARRNAKIANFGYFYGRSADAFAQDNPEVSHEEAMTLRELFLVKLYPEITAMHDHSVKELVEKGFVQTITGRRRRFRYCYGRDPQDIWWEGWVAWNSTVQGSAQDLIQIAMRDVFSDICVGRSGGPVETDDQKTLSFPADVWKRVKILIQVHDELVVEAPADVANDIAIWLSYRMGRAVVGQPVDFPAEAGIGSNWIEAKQAPKNNKHVDDDIDDDDESEDVA